jgi:hypothetical protein
MIRIMPRRDRQPGHARLIEPLPDDLFFETREGDLLAPQLLRDAPSFARSLDDLARRFGRPAGLAKAAGAGFQYHARRRAVSADLDMQED